jgi:sulfatase modifying factor 1
MKSKYFSDRLFATTVCNCFSRLKQACIMSTLAMSILANSGYQSFAGTVTFGSIGNQFTMDFVTIGNPNNAPDTTGIPSLAGSVGYAYGIGKYEVSEDMIDKYNLLNPTLQITKDTRGPSKPATSVSWNEAARFVNWLNTSTGGYAAYKFTTPFVNDNITPWSESEPDDYDETNSFRSKRATFVLPSYNEWYKAAYYDTGSQTYYDYTNGSDTAPDDIASGEMSNTAVYNQAYAQGPADVQKAGGPSPFGVIGLGGNVTEWEESTFDVLAGNYNDSGSSARGVRGGDWTSFAVSLSSSARYGFNFGSGAEFDSIGFRIVTLSPPAEVPEPSTMAMFCLGALGLVYRVRSKSKA